jgi:hypothetical protein
MLRDYMIKFKIIEWWWVFLAQNKHKSEVHKENNTKIKNIEEYKKFTHFSLC